MNKIAVYNEDTGDILSVVTGNRNIERAVENLKSGQGYMECDIQSPCGYIVSDGVIVRKPEEPKKQDHRKLRRMAYQREADPLFFKWQRGEATKKEYMDKVKEIKTKYPDT